MFTILICFILCLTGWKCANSNSLCGTTQTCQKNNHMISVFSHLLNISIMLPIADNDLKSIILYFTLQFKI